MDNGGGDPPASDQSRKELSISLAASSMINASDMITAQTYKDNLKRIQEVKEMVRKLEVNNEAAHKNFLVDQLEKRAKDGREAEDMLTRLRSQSGLSETVQFTDNAPSGMSDVILPTTATLVEVPESSTTFSHSSAAPAAASHPPQTVHPSKYQWNSPHVQPYYPDTFRYYVPPPVTPQPQHNAMLHTQAPTPQNGWFTTQNLHSRVHAPPAQVGFQPTQTQQPSQPWSNYPPVTSSGANVVSGYHAVPAGWVWTAPTHVGPGASAQSTTSRTPVANRNQQPNPSFRVQPPLQSVPTLPMKPPAGRPTLSGSLPKSTESQPRPASTTASKPVTNSEPRGPRKALQQPQPRPQSQRPPNPQLQFPQQQLEQQPRLSQPLPQPHSQLLPSQQPSQSSQTYRHAPPTDRAFSGDASQSHLPVGLSSGIPRTQLSLPNMPPEQQQGIQKSQIDQATFIKLFQSAVQRGALELKAFWFQAKAFGITDEWFRVAVSSLPRDVWQSALAQAGQSRPTLDTPPPASAPQQQPSTIPGSDVSVVNSPPPLTAAPFVQTPLTTRLEDGSGISAEGNTIHSVPKQGSESYAAQLQYYAEQAASASMSHSVNITRAQTVSATPQRDVLQAQASVRTPKDANKLTLARDILRALGKTVKKSRLETDKPVKQVNDRESDKLPEVTFEPASFQAPKKLAPVPLEITSVDINSPSLPSANPSGQNEPQHAAPSSQLVATSILPDKCGPAPVVEGPIMIDLTLDDLDESIDGNKQAPTLIQTSTGGTTSQPTSPTNTSNHTLLFENLSLAEPPLDAAGDSSKSDARMCIPPLTLTAEGNVTAEPLYPSLSAAEPIVSSIERPREESEHVLDGQLPLFLPSPPVSPVPTEPPVTEPEMIDDEEESRSSLKRRSVDTDKMEIDTEMAPSLSPPSRRVGKRQKQQVYVLIPPPPRYVKEAKMRKRVIAEGISSGMEGVGQDEELQYSHLEQLLIEESKLRLLERRCRWLNCGVILNCSASMLAHLRNHVSGEGAQAPFFCRWAGCNRQFGAEPERVRHLEGHATQPLPCPFAGCDEQFDKPVEVMQHEVQHQNAERREPLVHKRTRQPIVPAIPARLGPPPLRLEAHRVIPRRVAKCQISTDRHAVVGPWVLWNIFGPVELNMRKQNASMRGRLAKQATEDDMGSRYDDYDFLLAHSSHLARDSRLDDLDSVQVTMSAARGLTLWGTGVGDGKNQTVLGEEDAVERMLMCEGVATE